MSDTGRTGRTRRKEGQCCGVEAERRRWWRERRTGPQRACPRAPPMFDKGVARICTSAPGCDVLRNRGLSMAELGEVLSSPLGQLLRGVDRGVFECKPRTL